MDDRCKVCLNPKASVFSRTLCALCARSWDRYWSKYKTGLTGSGNIEVEYVHMAWLAMRRTHPIIARRRRMNRLRRG